MDDDGKLLERLVTLETASEYIKARDEEQTAEIERLREKLRALADESVTRSKFVKEKLSEFEELKSKVETLDKAVRYGATETGNINTNVTQNQGNLATLRERFTELDHRLSKNIEQDQNQESRIQGIERDVADMTTKLKVVQNALFPSDESSSYSQLKRDLEDINDLLKPADSTLVPYNNIRSGWGFFQRLIQILSALGLVTGAGVASLFFGVAPSENDNTAIIRELESREQRLEIEFEQIQSDISENEGAIETIRSDIYEVRLAE